MYTVLSSLWKKYLQTNCGRHHVEISWVLTVLFIYFRWILPHSNWIPNLNFRISDGNKDTEIIVLQKVKVPATDCFFALWQHCFGYSVGLAQLRMPHKFLFFVGNMRNASDAAGDGWHNYADWHISRMQGITYYRLARATAAVDTVENGILPHPPK